MNHIIIQKARSHKYIRREGAPGSYEYFYKRGFVKRESQVIVNKMNDLMKVFGQSDGMCGPASIRIALSAYGKSYTEKELAQLAKSTSSEGTTHGNMVITVRSQGIHTLTFQNMSKDHSLEILKNYVSQGDPCTSGTIRSWSRGSAGTAPRAGATRSCSTTPTIAR